MKDIGGVGFLRVFNQSQQRRRNIPVLALFGNDADGLFIVTCNHTHQRLTACRLKGNLIPYGKFHHLLVRACFPKKTQPLYDAVIQINQFAFIQRVDIDFWRHRSILISQ